LGTRALTVGGTDTGTAVVRINAGGVLITGLTSTGGRNLSRRDDEEDEAN